MNIPHQSSTFVTINESALTYYHSEYMVYIGVYSWCCTFYKFWHMYYDMHPLLWYYTEQFHKFLKGQQKIYFDSHSSDSPIDQ